jgi:hypothetical protein
VDSSRSSTPNLDALDARRFKRTFWGGYHIRATGTSSAGRRSRRCLREAGLEVVATRYQTGHSFWMYSFHHLLRYRLGMVALSHWFDPVKGLPFLIAFTGFDKLRAMMGFKTSADPGDRCASRSSKPNSTGAMLRAIAHQADLDGRHHGGHGVGADDAAGPEDRALPASDPRLTGPAKLDTHLLAAGRLEAAQQRPESRAQFAQFTRLENGTSASCDAKTGRGVPGVISGIQHHLLSLASSRGMNRSRIGAASSIS